MSWLAALPILVLVLVLLAPKKPSGARTPPGPARWPVIGNLPALLGPLPWVDLAALAQSFGPVMSLQLGCQFTVVLSSPSAIKEALVTKSSHFSSRPTMEIPDIVMHHGQDLGFAPYGPHWQRLRRLTTNKLFTDQRLHGIEQYTKGELASLLQAMLASEGRPFTVRPYFKRYPLNVVLQQLFSARFDNIEDGEFKALLAAVEEFFQICGVANPNDYFPWLKPLHRGPKRRALAIRAAIDVFYHKQLAGHLANLDPDRETHDMLETLLLEQRAQREAGDAEPLADQAIVCLLSDLVLAGTDTTSLSLEWLMANIASNPEEQRLLQQELDEVVGRDRLATLEDEGRLPRLSAAIQESARLCNAGPLLVPRMTTQATSVGGFDVPAGATVLCNQHAMTHDPAIYPEPHLFKPQRFVDDPRGAAQGVMPFGAGKRMCPGYKMAQHELFLGCAAMLQCFDWAPAGGKPLDMTARFGIAVGPLHAHEMQLTPRAGVDVARLISL